jgi:hypothetical protein
MALRDYGTAYDSAVATFYMNPASNPLIMDVVLTQLDRVQPFDKDAEASGNHRINNARTAFLVMESFLLDVEWHDTTSTLKAYDSLRGGASIADRWQMFLMVVSSKDTDILFEAYNETRPKLLMEAETDSEKKEPASMS